MSAMSIDWPGTATAAGHVPSATLEDDEVLDALMSPEALAALVVRLQAGHPAASSAMVRRSIADAVAAFRTARIRRYLPILIERAAWEALRTATSSSAQHPADGDSISGIGQR